MPPAKKKFHPDIIDFRYASDKKVKWFQHFLSLQEYFQALEAETWITVQSWRRLYYLGEGHLATPAVSRLFKLWFDQYKKTPEWKNPPIQKFRTIEEFNTYKEERRQEKPQGSTKEENPSKTPEAKTSESPESQNYPPDEEN